MSSGEAVKNVILPGFGPEKSGQQPSEPQQPGQHAAQAEEADLAVAQLQDLREHAAPAAGREKGIQALDHQDEGQGLPEAAAVHGLFLGRGRCPTLPAESLEEFRSRGVQHHHIALLGKAGLVGFQAAV